MGCINSKTDISDINPNIFRVVNVDENGDALWSGQLEISRKELVLYRKGRDPTRWSLQHLRRYGFESDIFTFEAGRRCPTGEGIFAFRCQRAENLFNVMQAYIQGIAMNDDTNRQSIDFNSLSLDLSSANTNQNRLSQHSISNSRLSNSLANPSTNYITPTTTNHITHSADGNYLEPTSVRHPTTFAQQPITSRLNSVGSGGPLSPDPNSPSSPNSITIILEVAQLNQGNNHRQINGNIYQEFSLKPSENNNNLLDKKLLLDVPPQEPAPVPTTEQIQSHQNLLASVSDETKIISPIQRTNSLPVDNDSQHMYVNVTPGEIDINNTNQTIYGLPRLSSTYSADLSTRCYENLEPGEFRITRTRYSKPDIFSKVELPKIVTTASKRNEETSEPTTPIFKEERKVNYIVLDLDNPPTINETPRSPENIRSPADEEESGKDENLTKIPKSSTVCSGIGIHHKMLNASVSSGTLTTTATTPDEPDYNMTKSTSTILSGCSILLSPKSPTIQESLGYATIDFNKTVALSNSTVPSMDLDNEGSRKTRHSSRSANEANSINEL